MGAGLAWLCRGLLASQLAEVPVADPLALAAAPAVVFTAAITATVRPALEATQVDVLTVLRAN